MKKDKLKKMKMKEEIGKWFLDIAKYLVTAVLITSVFDDIEKRWAMYLSVALAIVLTFIMGISPFREKKQKTKKGDK